MGASGDRGELSETVGQLAGDVAAGIESAELCRHVAAVAEQIREPLRVAIGGRLKAGKSTLVNALIGRRVAATAVGECTQVVAWYRYGERDLIEVLGRSGERWVIHPQLDGSLPAELGVPVEQVDHIEVSVTSRSRLGRLTLIDTPGLFSLNDEYSAGTRRALGLSSGEADRAAVSQADALVYLMPHPGDADLEFLRSLHGLYPESDLSAATAVGVLSRIDLLSPRPGREDPWPYARKVAGNHARKLRHTLRTVIPVAGLLAETALGGRFTEADAADVAALARLPDRRRMLQSEESFVKTELSGAADVDRNRLRGFLGLYGLSVCFSLVDDGAVRAKDLLDGLREASGVDALSTMLDAGFSQRAELWRAARALDQLERLSYRMDSALAEQLRDGIEVIRLRSDFHGVAEMRVLRQLEVGALSLPRERELELLELGQHIDPRARVGLGSDAGADELREAAARRRSDWRELENDERSTTASRAAARVARRSFELLVRQFESQSIAGRAGTFALGDTSNGRQQEPPRARQPG